MLALLVVVDVVVDVDEYVNSALADSALVVSHASAFNNRCSWGSRVDVLIGDGEL